jgi:hypothetical protein
MISSDHTQDVKYFVAFCGTGQSGSTVASALLDGHPNARIAFEQMPFKLWYAKHWSKEQIMQKMLTYGQGRHRQRFALPGSGSWLDRENQESLLVIGDKHGGDIRRLLADRTTDVGPSVVDEFSEFIGLPVKIIHTIRNPYDVVPAWVDKQKAIKTCPDLEKRFDRGIRRSLSLYKTMQPILDRHPHFELYNDDLIKDPRGTLTKLCEYLELPVVEPWLTTAAGIVFTEPHNRKDNREWGPGHKEKIEAQLIDKYPHYNRYKDS